MPPLLLLDANLLVLFVVGLADPNHIARHKRLRAYDEDDYRIVSMLVDASSGLLLTPNIVTETSNLLRQVPEPVRTEVSACLAAVVRAWEERYVPSRSVVDAADAMTLGVTDAVLLALAATGARLVTADLGLYLAASRAGYEAINYAHVQAARPDFR